MDLDLREIDTKLGPQLKWDKEKLIFKQPKGGRYPRALKVLERVKENSFESKRQSSRNSLNERLIEITKILSKNMSEDNEMLEQALREGKRYNTNYVSPAIGLPHPTNHDITW